MSLAIGISGWTYEGWRGNFYPPTLPHSLELEWASGLLKTIEINGTFYGLQRPTSYQRWFEETPGDFIFSVKANRYITHIKRLKDPEVGMANFFASGLLLLKEKLGPILWQFPPNMKFNPERFETFLSLLPHTFDQACHLALKSSLPHDKTALVYGSKPIRHAVEIRHDSFINPLFIDLLRKFGVALVFADTAGKWPYMEDFTSDFVYLRLHGDTELYVSGYDESTLNFWADRMSAWEDGKVVKNQLSLEDSVYYPLRKRDIFVYFDNDVKVRAPFDAMNLQDICFEKTKTL